MKPVSVDDTGYSGSAEMNPEAIATASGIDIDMVNEERKDKYKIDDDIAKKQNIVDEERKGHGFSPVERDRAIKEKKERAKKEPGLEEHAKAKPSEEKKQLKKIERNLSADDKDEIHKKRSSQKNKKQPGAHSNSPFDKV